VREGDRGQRRCGRPATVANKSGGCLLGRVNLRGVTGGGARIPTATAALHSTAEESTRGWHRRLGRVEDGRGSLGPMANAPFPIPAHRTGRAQLICKASGSPAGFAARHTTVQLMASVRGVGGHVPHRRLHRGTVESRALPPALSHLPSKGSFAGRSGSATSLILLTTTLDRRVSIAQ
jgi:hypothetical protein